MIDGECDVRFTAVRDAFAASFEAGREIGASFAATVDGRVVVDLWGGNADAARTRPWERDTITTVFSTTKAMVAICAHVLVDRGLLDLDAPVARYWPEFAQADKSAIPVRWLLSHSAGLAAIRTPLPSEALFDWPRMTDVLASEAPEWPPGTASGYHALTYGHLVGEVIRRVAGTSVGRFFHDEVAGPVAADFHIGLDRREDGRVAEMVGPSQEETAPLRGAVRPGSLLARVLANPRLTPSLANTDAWRRAEVPAVNGHGNARSVARILAVLACGGTLDGVRLMTGETLARATAEQWRGRDLVLSIPMRWGLGFMLTSPELPFGPNPHAFGHGGWGGSLGIADCDARVSWAYVMNKMSAGTTGDFRAAALAGAFYGSL